MRIILFVLLSCFALVPAASAKSPIINYKTRFIPGAVNPFGLVGGAANEIEPGKRPLSSMTPTLVLKGGKAWLTTGSPGGSTIITKSVTINTQNAEEPKNET